MGVPKDSQEFLGKTTEYINKSFQPSPRVFVPFPISQIIAYHGPKDPVLVADIVRKEDPLIEFVQTLNNLRIS